MPMKEKSKMVARRATLPGLDRQVEAAVASLKRLGNKRTRDEMATRYGIHLPDPSKALGVPMNAIQRLARQITRDGGGHDLALALWDSGWYEARLLASLIDEPDRVTAAQVDRWCRDFDNWGVVD